jgi:hypothetical protein
MEWSASTLEPSGEATRGLDEAERGEQGEKANADMAPLQPLKYRVLSAAVRTRCWAEGVLRVLLVIMCVAACR